MIKWMLRQIVIAALNDSRTRLEIMKVVNPDYWWELKYGDRKNPPPKPTWTLQEQMRTANEQTY
jgi:hypothetical protein